MDNWDYKFEHPVIVGRARSPVTAVSDYVYARAASPDDSTPASEDAEIISRSDTDEVYGDYGRIVLAFPAPVVLQPGEMGHLVLGSHFFSEAIYTYSGSVVAIAYANLKVTPITDSFDIASEASFNNIPSLTLGTPAEIVLHFGGSTLGTNGAQSYIGDSTWPATDFVPVGVQLEGPLTIHGAVIDMKPTDYPSATGVTLARSRLHMTADQSGRNYLVKL